jgi:hypothetical protein
VAGRPRQKARLLEAAANGGPPLPEKYSGDSPEDRRERGRLTRQVRRELVEAATAKGIELAMDRVLPQIMGQLAVLSDVTESLLKHLLVAAEAGDVERLAELTKSYKDLRAIQEKGVDRRFGTPTSRAQIESKNLNVSLDVTELVKGRGV